MTNEGKGQIKVIYKYVDGAHFFWSQDDLAKGLCVASQDPETAYNEVTAQLNVLITHHLKLPKKASVKPALPYEAFFAWLQKNIEEASPSFSPIPSASLSWASLAQAA